MQKYTLIIIFSISVVGAQAGEKKINRRDLPVAVEKTVVSQSRGATIRGFSQEQEHGKTYFEVQLVVEGHSKDVEMDSDGQVTEVEEQVSFGALPATVQAALQAKAGNGKLTKVESITKRNQLVAYEAQVMTGSKRSEVQVGPNGKPLNHDE